MPNKHVVLVGNVATGKTTVLQHLSLQPSIRVVPADELFLINPFFKLSKTDPVRWDFTNDLWFLMGRAEIMRQAFQEQKKNKKTLVVDSGIWMSYLYGFVHAQVEHDMNSAEWKFFEECFDQVYRELPLPDVIVHLTAPFEVQRERIVKRGRAFEIEQYFEYLHEINKGLEGLKAKVESLGIKYVEIPTESSQIKEIAKKVENAI